MRGERRQPSAGLAILLLLLVLQLALADAHLSSKAPGFGGDEPSYVGKALELREHGGFPRLPEDSRGKPFPNDFWGNSDWRPVGYPLFLAAVGAEGFEPRATRLRVTVLQFGGVAIALLLSYGLAIRWLGVGGRASLLVAAGLGLQPWTFAYVGLIGPESLTMTMTWMGTVALAAASASRGRTAVLAVATGSFALTGAGLLRPESLALAPPLVVLALWLGPRQKAELLTKAAAAAIAFLSIISLQVAYRWQLSGRVEIFGPARFFNGGFLRWINTWVNTEKGAYDGLAYRIGSGTVRIDELPSRAFLGTWDREQVSSTLERIRAEGGYTREVDQSFAAIAAWKTSNAPLSCFVIPRVARTFQLWLNLESNSQLLEALSRAPRVVSRGVIAAATASRIVVLGLFFVAVGVSLQAARLPREIGQALLLLSIAYVLLRTLLVGAALGWAVARYMHPAWMPMLWCAIVGALEVSRAWTSRVAGS